MSNELDGNKIAAEVITAFVEKTVTKALSAGKSFIEDQLKKSQVDFNLAFSEYLKNAYNKYSVVRTLLHRDEPQFIYDGYECNDLTIPDQKGLCKQLSSDRTKHQRCLC